MHVAYMHTGVTGRLPPTTLRMLCQTDRDPHSLMHTRACLGGWQFGRRGSGRGIPPSSVRRHVGGTSGHWRQSRWEGPPGSQHQQIVPVRVYLYVICVFGVYMRVWLYAYAIFRGIPRHFQGQCIRGGYRISPRGGRPMTDWCLNAID